MNRIVLIAVMPFAAAFWQTACRQFSGLSDSERATYMNRGDSLTRISFDTLRITLLRTIGQVQPGVLAMIDSLYPGDLARGYREWELRSVWLVRFARKPD